ncbi:MAG: glycoside hydrolase family 65 protein, partial [Lachnospiraceae bacterium]|nr:glycoside hydrolase family 65 protein [Lachnospiraceae bacterium]
MDYSKIGEWILCEDSFDPENLGKCEAVMSLGNGYMGLRSATEEHYLNETRGLFVAGTFNKFDENEVTELPNGADMTAMDIFINGERFSLADGTVEAYTRELNVRTGELERRITWISQKGVKIYLKFCRIVSLKRLHVIAQRMEITPEEDVEVKLHSGIDGRMTNTGSQHFSDGDKRFYEKRFIQFVQTTSQSKIDFVNTTVHKLLLNGEVLPLEAAVYIERRKIYAGFEISVKAGETLAVEKYSNVYTSRDLDGAGMDTAALQEISLATGRELEKAGYKALQEESAAQWEKEVWGPVPILIEGSEMDQFSIRFAQYHLRLMVPAHDTRMNIGAKGLSGEGYRGHTFWDTEIFLLPYYIFTDPKTARKLEEYRYLSLPGAHAKAAHNHYKGAMFPWESAWLDDGEVTPEYMDVDILTGKPNKVWSGIIEQHITSDVAFGVWQYSVITGDEDYMDKYGYELIMDTAIFWASRLEKGGDGRYHINDVVGPDEYREHVNDNAFTNYMAHWNMKKAMEYYHLLKSTKQEIFDRLNEKLGLEEAYGQWEEGCKNIY